MSHRGLTGSPGTSGSKGKGAGMRSVVAALTMVALTAANAQAGLFGKLGTENGRYVFEKITNQMTQEKLVDLTTITPVHYYVPKDEYCVSSLWNLCDRPFCRTDEFLDKRTEVGKALLTYTAGLVALPYTLVCGGLTLPRRVNFDYKAFQSAVREAGANSGLDGIKASYRELEESLAANTNKMEERVREGEGIYRRYSGDLKRNAAKLKPEIRVTDQSGFWTKDPALLVSLTFAEPDFGPKFRYAVPTLNSWISAPARQFRAEAKRIELENQRVTDKALSEMEASLKRYEKQVAGAVEQVAISNRSRSRYEGFHYKVETVGKIGFKDAPDKIPVQVTITSRDFQGIFPPYENKDQNLTVLSDGGGLTFVNGTDKPIKIISVAVYYNDKVTDRPLEFPLEIPPKAKVNKALALFVDLVVYGEASYSKLTKAAAEQLNIEYGIAVKYKVGEPGVENNLARVNKKYNLFEVIKNKGG